MEHTSAYNYNHNYNYNYNPGHGILDRRGRPHGRWIDEALRGLQMLTAWAEGETAARN
jgi:hypothetical protein